MRNLLSALAFAAVLSIGTAHAAPAFGASAHRLGAAGGAGKASAESRPQSLLEAIISLVRFDLSAKTAPIVSEAYPGVAANAKECDKAEKTELAKADTAKQTDGGESAKGRARTGDPVYLAF